MTFKAFLLGLLSLSSVARADSGRVLHANEVQVYNGTNTANYVDLQAQAGMTAPFSLFLPTTAGTQYQAMVIDGSGNLFFTYDFKDSSGFESLDVLNRSLVANDGSTVMLAWPTNSTLVVGNGVAGPALASSFYGWNLNQDGTGYLAGNAISFDLFGDLIAGEIQDASALAAVNIGARQLIASDGSTVSETWSGGGVTLSDESSVFSPTAGTIAWHSYSNTLSYYDGMTWNDLGGGLWAYDNVTNALRPTGPRNLEMYPGQTIVDDSGPTSIDSNSRHLVASDGTTVAVDWSNPANVTIATTLQLGAITSDGYSQLQVVKGSDITAVADSNSIMQLRSGTGATNVWFDTAGNNATFGFANNGTITQALEYDNTRTQLGLSGNGNYGYPDTMYIDQSYNTYFRGPLYTFTENYPSANTTSKSLDLGARKLYYSDGTTTFLDYSTLPAANKFYAGPTSGAAAAPTFRSIVSADIPNNAANTSGSAASFTGSLSGDVTGTQSATAIAANAVTNAKLAQMPSNTFKGNNTGSTANAIDMTAAQAVAILPTVVGDSGSGGAQGVIPAPPAGSYAAGDYLLANGTWAYVDQSKPYYQPFTMISKTANPTALSKINNVLVYTGVNGKTYAVTIGTVSSTLAIYDATDQASPILLSNMATLQGSYNAVHALISGVDYIIVASSGGYNLYIINVSNPYSPTITTTFNLTSATGSTYNIAYSNGMVYLACQTVGLKVVDIGNGIGGGTLTAPVVTYTQGAAKSFGVVVSGTNLFTTQYSTSPYATRLLNSWTLTGAGTIGVPSLVQSLTLPGLGEALAISINASATTAFVSINTGVQQLDVVDITTPSAMTNITQVSMPAGYTIGSAMAAAPSGNYVFMPVGSNATYGGAVLMYDITNRSNPVLINNVVTGVATVPFGGIAISGGYIFAGDYGVAPGSTGSLDIFTMPLTTPTWGLATGSNLNVINSVGIGSTAPQGILDVEGGSAAAAASGTNINIVAQNGGSTAGNNGGNVVITAGTASGTGATLGQRGGIILNAPTATTYLASAPTVPAVTIEAYGNSSGGQMMNLVGNAALDFVSLSSQTNAPPIAWSYSDSSPNSPIANINVTTGNGKGNTIGFGTNYSPTSGNLQYFMNFTGFDKGSLLIGATSQGTYPDAVLQVNGAIATAVAAKTTTYTANANDSVILCNATSAAFTVTLPTAASITGTEYMIKKTDSSVNACTVGTTSSQTIDGSTTYALSLQYKYVRVISDGANWQIFGNN